MSQIRFGTDGVRGEWGSEIAPETGYRLGAAAMLQYRLGELAV
jgi:phosphomannomutase